MAGRPLRRKNHARAVEIAAFSAQLRKLIVIGQEKTTSLDPRVVHLGIIRHRELMELLIGVNVLLQTSDWEGEEIDSLPTTVLEALAMGIPVVSTPLPGVVELNSVFPNFVRIAEDADEMASCLDALLADAEKLEASEARRWVLRRHGRSQVTARLVGLYEGLLR